MNIYHLTCGSAGAVVVAEDEAKALRLAESETGLPWARASNVRCERIGCASDVRRQYVVVSSAVRETPPPGATVRPSS
jgi:hypothetical protein